MKDVNYLVSNGVNVEKSLELFGDMDMYDATLNDFVEDVEKRLDSLKKFREIGDMPNYAIEVHALKSDARYLGFVTLADLAYQFELKSKANDIMYVYDNYQTLLNEANRCANIARTYLGKEVKQDLISDMIGEKTEAILVVDDSNLVANFIKKIFDNKYEVYIANDGQRAIDLVSGENASKIKGMLLDLNMPNVNGFEVLEYFKNNNLFVKIPVSIITGNDTRDQVDEAFKYPIVDLLSKPFNERDIKRIVEKTIQNF